MSLSSAGASTRVVIAGVSTRAAAESAARAGFDVTAIDSFGDLDQHASVRSVSLLRDSRTPFSPLAAARVSQTIACDAVVYLSNFENHPTAVSALASGRALWGNAPAVLRRVHDPLLVSQTLRQRGFAVPNTRVVSDDRLRTKLSPPLKASADAAGSTAAWPVEGRWLVKPRASGGGHGVQPWRGGAQPPRGHYLQERVEGTPGSVVFVAAGGRAVPLGISRQIIGEPAFGVDGYRYCGNILTPADDPQLACETFMNGVRNLVNVIAEEFGLVGLNGIDFIAHDDVTFAIEVNPRWCASMELVERAYRLSMFAVHAAACVDGTLPEFELERARTRAGAVGKAVVFARQDVTVGDTRAWIADAVIGSATTIRDIPHPGERILAGRPVCTVFAGGRDADGCHAALVERAERVYAKLATWDRGVAQQTHMV